MAERDPATAMRLTALRCGHISIDIGLLEGGGLQHHNRSVPSMAFVLEHPEGVLVWDTSMNPAVCAGAVDYWGPLAASLVVPHYTREETTVSRLAEVGIDADDVRFVVNSHLHNDHCGMNRFFPRATTLVRREEYQHAVGVTGDPYSGYIANDFLGDDVGPEYLDYDDQLALFGDESVVLLSTIGHTPGHQSLQITFPSGRSIVLTGDALYTAAQLASGSPPGITADNAEATRSARHLSDLQDAGTAVLVAHEPAHWTNVETTAVVHAER
jgi:N-acyl homoserine lactone hydrolase